jgi:hypothetical protein
MLGFTGVNPFPNGNDGNAFSKKKFLTYYIGSYLEHKKILVDEFVTEDATAKKKK